MSNFCRCRVSRDGAQHPVSRNVGIRRQSRQVRRASCFTTDGERPDRPSRAYRRPRLRAFHREVPAGGRTEVLQIRKGLSSSRKPN